MPQFHQCRDVICVQSLPRLTYSSNHASIAMTLPALGINLHVAGGAYWHHCISQAIREHMADTELKYVLTNDYDTPMRKEWVLELYDIMEANAWMDSLQGVQVRRETTELMYRVRISPTELRLPMQQDSKEPLLKIATGHFGLTLFRISAFKRLSLPWMHEKPDEEGFWSERALHPDIAFWFNMEAAGCECYQDNRLLLPHSNEFLCYPTPDFSQTALQPAGMFEKYGPLDLGPAPGEGK